MRVVSEDGTNNFTWGPLVGTVWKMETLVLRVPAPKYLRRTGGCYTGEGVSTTIIAEDAPIRCHSRIAW